MNTITNEDFKQSGLTKRSERSYQRPARPESPNMAQLLQREDGYLKQATLRPPISRKVVPVITIPRMPTIPIIAEFDRPEPPRDAADDRGEVYAFVAVAICCVVEPLLRHPIGTLCGIVGVLFLAIVMKVL